MYWVVHILLAFAEKSGRKEMKAGRGHSAHAKQQLLEPKRCLAKGTKSVEEDVINLLSSDAED